MNLKNYYYYYTAALSSKFIDDIMREGLRRQSQMAATGGVENKTGDKLTAKEIQNIQQKRKSEVVWLDEKWIYNEIHPYIHEANAKAGWNFDWDLVKVLNLQNME